MKTIIPYCALLAAFGTGAVPLETAELRFARTDGTLSSESRRLVSMPDGARRLTVTVAEIARDVRALDVVLDAAVQPKDARGWWVIGDGRYGKMTRERGSLKSNRERMALFGMSVPSVTWCAVVKGLRLEYECHVDVRDGVYCVFPRFEIAGIEFDPYEDVVIDFYELKGRDANYSAMGRLYRSYQLGRGEVKPLRERIVGNPALAYATESIFLRCKFGRCDRRTSTRADWETNMPPVSVDYTFEDFRKIMRACKEAGIDKADMCLVGFQQGGHDGPFPDLFPADERFGGEAGMRETIAYGKSLGYRMSIHLNQHNFYRNARRWCEADVSKGVDGQVRRYGTLPGGPVYHSCYEVICNRYFDKDLADMKDLGLDGLVHVDVMSARLPTQCHDPRHPNNRAEEAGWLKKLGLKARAAFGGYSSECGFDHCAAILDNCLYVSPYPGWACRKTELVDGTLPIWQIAYNGIIMSTPFYATLDAGTPRAANGTSDAVGKNAEVYEFLGSPERTLLKLFEYGGRPMFYYTDYRRDVAAIKRVYDAWRPLRHLQLEFMDEHAELAPEVFVTRYANGEELVTNYSEKPYAYRGHAVRPLGYELFADGSTVKNGEGR